MIRTTITIDGKNVSNYEFTHVSLIQKIGGHHEFEVRFRQDPLRGVLGQTADKWFGKKIKIGIGQELDINLDSVAIKELFEGVITSVFLSRQRGTGELVVAGKSTTIFLDDGPQTRSFTDKGLQEIVDEVCGAYSAPFKAAPAVVSKPLSYVVQYEESNWEFIKRLANQYGEWLYNDGKTLYFGKPAESPEIKLDFGAQGLYFFEMGLSATPVKFKYFGYDYLKDQDQTEQSPANAKTSELGDKVRTISKRDLFSKDANFYAGGNMDAGDKELKQMAVRRDQINADEMVLLNGSSRNANLVVGAKISIRDNESGEDYGSFAIVHLSHSIGQQGDYTNSFQAIPAEVETPPLTTMPRPPVAAMQLAKVTDVNDPEKLGRIRVSFTWQASNGEKTPWLRVASPYTGKDKGFYIIPEVGDQVVTAFEGNDPEKPYVLTGMYHGKAKPAWFEAKNRFKGFKSKAGNEWKFDDESKQIHINAPNKILLTAGKTIEMHAGSKDKIGSIVMQENVININASNSGKIIINAEGGNVVLSADKIYIMASESIDGEAKKTITLDSTMSLTLKGNKVSVEGGMMTDIKGGVIKLN